MSLRNDDYFMLFPISWLYRLKFIQTIGISTCLLLSITACSTLPPQQSVGSESSVVPAISHHSSTLKRQLAPLRQQYPHLTGYHLLINPEEALSARLSLIERAEHSIDVQYYIWENDEIGSLLFDALLKAGDRGVKVRLLIDDNNAKNIEEVLLVLSSHQNIEVKLFNPYRFRKYRAVDMVLDTKRINRRMHNKSLIVDGELSIIGGRNIANQYFNLGQKFQFADIDVLLAGVANDEVQQAFNEYWSHDYAYDVHQIVKTKHHDIDNENYRLKLNTYFTHLKHSQDEKYLKIQQNKRIFSEWQKNQFTLQWVDAKVFVDSPEKVRKAVDKTQYVLPQIMKNIPQPTQQLDIISAYFIPQQQGLNYLQQLEYSGVDVRIITNSLHSTDVKGVHAYYSPYRKPLLESGVQLYEFLPIINIDDFIQQHIQYSKSLPNYEQKSSSLNKKTKKNKQPKISLEQQPYRSFLSGSSNASLHAKALIVDKQFVFVGSMNIDPRSFYYNTEIGVLLNSPHLANHLHQNINDTVNQYTWHLMLNAQQQLRWVRPATANTPAVEYQQDPYSSRWHRFLNGLLRTLPLEKYF